MAIGMEARYSDEEIRAMVHRGIVDPDEEDESLKAQQRAVRRTLQAPTAFPTIAQLVWVDYVEGTAVVLADDMAGNGDNLRNGARVFAGRRLGACCEEEAALVAKLRRQAARCEERRAQAQALAADARRLRDKYLRAASGISVGNKDGGEALRAATAEFREHVAREMEDDGVSVADMARPEAIDAAARAGQGIGQRFVEEVLSGLSQRLRRHALDYGARDKALKEALCRRAAEMEEMCADPEKLVERMLASSVWRWPSSYHGGGNGVLKSKADKICDLKTYAILVVA
ncbi:uncharacterized protein LOC104581501 isoform X2 [Brachypodium distachyon]|uniref:uncharacterized protein LOC104581501 isoform X2 n=1 Tax=Brachypodium distachyon TaxID=15368 RepID=UPI00071CE253|nr:uncharacterized protein LOC104581501 isoform X2 [Brachypodium distachyon]|eukprot:XP_014756005.1 uncharacterized protein LOC104581501 isoform X2 [Brachypodium distachyon]